MDSRQEQLRIGLSRFLSARWRPETEVTDLVHIPGGASRETWRLKAASGGDVRGLIARIDPESSLIDTDRRTEHVAMTAAFKAGLPAPETLFLEEDLSWVGRPFSITVEITGGSASFYDIPADHRDALGWATWNMLGRIAALDPAAMDLGEALRPTTRETCAAEQLDYWAGVIAKDELHPNPLAHAALRWLRRHPPPPAQKLSLVHGDYRTGNFLYSPEGEIKAVLDWEMAHIGDPLEDLAWSMDPQWGFKFPDLAGRLLGRGAAVRAWEETSGLKADPAALRWWQVFAAVKGIGIWLSSSEDFHSGDRKAPVLAMAGWLCTDRQQQILADYLSPHASHRFEVDAS